MTRIEVQKVLATLDMIYSNFKVDDATAMVDIWHRFLQKYEYADISAAIDEYVETSGSSFAPNVSQLIGIVKKHTVIPIKLSLLSSAEAWVMVRKALERGTYHYKEEFENLPRMVQKAVGAAEQLQVWATDDDYNESVISSVFKKNYENICKQELEYKDLTDQQKLGVNVAKQKLLEGEELSEIDFNAPSKAIETF